MYYIAPKELPHQDSKITPTQDWVEQWTVQVMMKMTNIVAASKRCGLFLRRKMNMYGDGQGPGRRTGGFDDGQNLSTYGQPVKDKPQGIRYYLGSTGFPPQ